MTNQLIQAHALVNALRKFAEEREWERFHSPKNLSMALSVEVAELVEIFQWLTEDESRNAANDDALKNAISEEVADVLIYLVRLADKLEIDLNDAVSKKIIKNAQKYPASHKT